jgi:hypothetical protein
MIYGGRDGNINNNGLANTGADGEAFFIISAHPRLR